MISRVTSIGTVTGPGLAVAVVARRLGVAPATLRTWDRRYGLGPSERTVGAHRRYTPGDVARLIIMRRLTLEGVAPADAAAIALESEVSAADIIGAGGELTTETAALGSVASLRTHLRAIPGGPSADFSMADSNAITIPTNLSARIAAVIDSALGYDQATCNALLYLDVQDDPAAWWTQLVEPAWQRIAQRTVLGTPGEDPELVLSNAAMTALRNFILTFEQVEVAGGKPSAAHPSRMSKIALIFAAPDEMVPLVAHALAASLVAAGAIARIVTGPVSAHRALELVTMVRPAAVVLATNLARPDLDVVYAVHDKFESLPIFVGLRREDSASDVPLAANVQRVRSFTGLLHEVLAVVGKRSADN
ncbi:MAG: MerR family transcriptional regulator [Promicromonosporaceae bacterium]|nr:MerR family transcriptional regulator [Promicromonosporaceae bacterium]